MVVIAGSLTVERPDGTVETRRRGFASPPTIPTGRWRFTAGPEGCRYVCTHPRDDGAYRKTAVVLAAGALSADLSGHGWLLVADGTVRDGSGPLAPETLIDLTGRDGEYRLAAEDDALLVAIDEIAAGCSLMPATGDIRIAKNGLLAGRSRLDLLDRLRDVAPAGGAADRRRPAPGDPGRLRRPGPYAHG